MGKVGEIASGAKYRMENFKINKMTKLFDTRSPNVSRISHLNSSDMIK